jgi:hypothetical protein
MTQRADKWNLRRKATAGERVVGICCGSLATLLFLALAALFGYGLLSEPHRPDRVGMSILFAVLLSALSLSVWLLYTFIFTPPESLTAKGASRLATVVVGLSVGLIGLGLVLLPSGDTHAWLISLIGLAGISGGIQNLRGSNDRNS